MIKSFVVVTRFINHWKKFKEISEQFKRICNLQTIQLISCFYRLLEAKSGSKRAPPPQNVFVAF